MSRDNIISFMDNMGTARQRVADAKLNAIVIRLREQTGTVLPRLLQDLFENLDDDLFQLADKSGSDLMQTRYFETMRELRKLRNPIQDAMMRAVLNQFDAFWSGEPGDYISNGSEEVDGDSDNLALMSEEDLEENLAVSGVVSKAESKFQPVLFALGQRFGHLIGVEEISATDNPVGPRALAGAFRRGLDLWNGELPVKLVIFKLFERHVMTYVGGLYDDLNDALIAADVLPKLPSQVKRNPVAPSVQRVRGEAEEQAAQEAADRAKAKDADLSANLMEVVTQLLAERRALTGVDARLMHLPVVPSEQLVNVLNDLQRAALVDGASTLNEALEVRDNITGHLFQQLELGSGEHRIKRLEQGDQDILDVVSMVFDFILDDPNLPDAMKALLSRLQIPMAKVAMLDKGFFSSKGHPARRLLNNLARSVVGWVDDGDRTPQSLYGRVEAVVTRVLTDFVDDMSLFDVLDKEFTAVQERETRSAQVAEERMAQVSRGQEHLKLARRRVETVIKECLGDREGLPEPATDLLNEPWRDVLLLAYLREGEDSETWREAVEVAHRLVWSVTPKIEQRDRQELLKIIPDLLRRMREGLANISYDQHKAATLFKQLQACHIGALRGQEPEACKITRPVIHEAEQKPAPVVVQDQFYRQAKAMEPGQWLEWEQGDRKLRGKLSWKSELTGACVFVNRKGLKNAEMRLDELAALLREGKAEPLADAGSPLMDRALTAMLDALKNTAPPAEPSPV